MPRRDLRPFLSGILAGVCLALVFGWLAGCAGKVTPPNTGGSASAEGAPTPREIWTHSDLNRILNVDKKLRIGLEAEFKPFEYKTATGELVGFDVDLARMLAAELGVPVEFTETKWDGIISDLQSNKYDLIMSGLTGTPERGRTISFSRPYFKTGLCVLLNSAKAGMVTEVHQLDTAERTIAVKTGTTSDQWVTDHFSKATILRVGEEASAALEVAQSRADAMIYDQLSIVGHHAEYPDTTKALLTPFTYEPYCIGMRKGDIELKNWIDHTLDVIEHDGRMEELRKKHFGDLPAE